MVRYLAYMRGNCYYKRLGRRICLERKRCKISQESLAGEAQIDRTYLARIEEGKANPTLKVLYKISQRLKMRVERLLRDV